MRSSYPLKPMGELLRLEYGKPLPAADRTDQQNIPAFGANGVLCWSRKAFRTNPSIIVGRKGSAGEINLTYGPYWPTDVTYFVEHDARETDLRYLFYLLKFLELPKMARGVKPGINRNDVYALTVPAPPLDEQKRIVAILDEAFEGIAKATANAERNLANARDAFDWYAQKIFDLEGSKWSSATLGEIYDVRDGTHDSPTYQADGFPLITSKNLKRDGLNFENVKMISEMDFNKINHRSKVDRGDVLLAMIGTIGNPVVVIDEPEFAIKNVALLKVPQNHDSYFLRYYLSTENVVRKMQRDAKGTTQKFVGLGYLREFPIKVPNLEEQQRIVRLLDQTLVQTNSLEANYKSLLALITELKTSILAKAFSGQLTGKEAIAA